LILLCTTDIKDQTIQEDFSGQTVLEEKELTAM